MLLKRKDAKIKKVIIIILIVVLALLIMPSFSKNPQSFTEEEHIQRISERIKKRFITEKNDYTDFIVYPLYNENEELVYFLVEFEPVGFLFVRMREGGLRFFSWFVPTSMYSISNCLYGNNASWSPYMIDETNSQPFPDSEKKWIVDENGEKINYLKSPYNVTNNKNEKKYLLSSIQSTEYICAVQKDGKFINLISMTEVDVENGDLTKKQATMYVAFIGKKRFDI